MIPWDLNKHREFFCDLKKDTCDSMGFEPEKTCEFMGFEQGECWFHGIKDMNMMIFIVTYSSLSLSIYLSIYRSIDLSIYRSIDRSIDRSIYLPIYLSIYLYGDPVILTRIIVIYIDFWDVRKEHGVLSWDLKKNNCDPQAIHNLLDKGHILQVGYQCAYYSPWTSYSDGP